MFTLLGTEAAWLTPVVLNEAVAAMDPFAFTTMALQITSSTPLRSMTLALTVETFVLPKLEDVVGAGQNIQACDALSLVMPN